MADSLRTGIWDRMHQAAKESREHQLRVERVKKLVAASRAPTTSKAYNLSYQKFHDYCKSEGTDPKKAGSYEVVMYLEKLASENKLAATVMQAVSAIAWHYQMADRRDPTKHKLVTSLVSAAKRSAPAVQHKVPAVLDHLKWLRDQARKSRTFAASRTFVVALTLYATCSRLDDVIALQRQHVSIQSAYV